MKFPRSAKILRSQFDIAPFAAVFFALLILLLLGGLDARARPAGQLAAAHRR